ncbi:MAG: DUF3793 family protein [Tissierellia bacterium]|nr:DUF3793 family protein [Tissierellia bacterium]
MNKLVQTMQDFSDDEFLLYILSSRLAPVFEGLRPSCLFCLRNTGRGLYSSWKRNETNILSSLPFNSYILKDDGTSIHILIYSRDELAKYIDKPGISTLLKNYGYDDGGLDSHLNWLKHRFKEGCPHENGVFLGYPLPDVISFINNKRPCLITGYWKVYCHKQDAEQQFAAFDRAKEKVISHIINGAPIHQVFDKMCFTGL